MPFLYSFKLFNSRLWLVKHCRLILGIEEVKLVTLSALASWCSKSTEAVQPDVVSFIAAGLKEKEALRKGNLRCLQAICKNSDSLTRVC